MWGWLQELLEIRYQFKERNYRLSEERIEHRDKCPSCEILKQQLEISNYEKKLLLDRVMTPVSNEPRESKSVEISVPKNIPWSVRRQLLEKEDREKARLMREAPISSNKIEGIEELEREMGIIESERELKEQ